MNRPLTGHSRPSGEEHVEGKGHHQADDGSVAASSPMSPDPQGHAENRKNEGCKGQGNPSVYFDTALELDIARRLAGIPEQLSNGFLDRLLGLTRDRLRFRKLDRDAQRSKTADAVFARIVFVEVVVGSVLQKDLEPAAIRADDDLPGPAQDNLVPACLRSLGKKNALPDVTPYLDIMNVKKDTGKVLVKDSWLDL